jgi:hypothetical protein
VKIVRDLVEDVFSKTSHPGKLTDLERINILRKSYEDIYNNDRDRYEFYYNSMQQFEKSLMIDGILEDGIIEMNKHRKGFIRDRSYIDENGNRQEDEYFSTFMITFSKIVEEGTSLSLFREDNMMKYDFCLYDNPKSTKINSLDQVNGLPDFIIKDKNGISGYCEQKTIYSDSNKIFIRPSQYKLFDKLDYVCILVKKIDIENGIHTYYLYDYDDIKEHLKFHTFYGKYEMDLNKVQPMKVIKDYYKKVS